MKHAVQKALTIPFLLGSIFTLPQIPFGNLFHPPLIFKPAKTSETSLTRSNSFKIPILIFHGIRDARPFDNLMQLRYNVSPASLEKELAYLNDNGYTSITFDELRKIIEGNEVPPAKPIIISFDDGWKDQFTNAFPLLEKYRLNATFFIYTNAIGKEYFMSWDDVKKMARAGMQIGGHTESHPYLPTTPEKQVKEEIEGGKIAIEKELGTKITAFAYPFGHYTDDAIKFAKEAGFMEARTTYPGEFHTKNDLYTLKGIEVTNDFSTFVKEI